MQYFISKGIDKCNKVCYNIDTVKERNKDLKKEVDDMKGNAYKKTVGGWGSRKWHTAVSKRKIRENGKRECRNYKG